MMGYLDDSSDEDSKKEKPKDAYSQSLKSAKAFNQYITNKHLEKEAEKKRLREQEQKEEEERKRKDASAKMSG
jgi:hypothetical protein